MLPQPRRPPKAAFVLDDHLLKLVHDSMDNTHPVASSSAFKSFDDVKVHHHITPLNTVDASRPGLPPMGDVDNPDGVTTLAGIHSRKPKRYKEVRRQKFSKDVCEILQLCGDCQRSGGLENRDSVSQRTRHLVTLLATTLLETRKWPINIWETLRFASDVIGLPVLLAEEIVKRGVGQKIGNGVVERTLRLLTTAEHRPATKRSSTLTSFQSHLKGSDTEPMLDRLKVSSKAEADLTILPRNALHSALERVVQYSIANVRKSDPKFKEQDYQVNEDQDCYYLYRLLERLTDDAIISDTFVSRLPLEFLRNVISHIERIDKFKSVSDPKRSALQKCVQDQITATTPYKSAVAEFLENNLEGFNRKETRITSADAWKYEALLMFAEFVRQHSEKALRHELVRGICVSASNMNLEMRESVMWVLETLIQFRVFNEDDIQIGFERSLSRIEDMVLDHPMYGPSFSRLIYVALCENTISVQAVEYWVRLRIGGEVGQAVLRRCLLWMERRQDSTNLGRFRLNTEWDCKDWLQNEQGDDAKMVLAEISRILTAMTDQLNDDFTSITVLSEEAADEIERTCNHYPNSCVFIALVIISHYGVPKAHMAPSCIDILKVMKRKHYTNDVVIGYAMKEYYQAGPSLSGSVYALESHGVQTRELVVKNIEKSLLDVK